MKAPATLAERKRLPTTLLIGNALQHTSVRPLTGHATPADARNGTQTPDLGHDFSQVPAHTQSTPCLTVPMRCPFGGACHACPLPLQAKLAVNRPGDRYEQEADRVAEEVHWRRRATGQVEPVHVPEIVHQVLRSPGQPLDEQTRASIEPRLGHDLGHVRVHTDARAAASAHAVNARAYTIGRDVVFEDGQYAPGTTTGNRLLAHELTHVVQQSGHSTGTFAGLRIGGVSNAYEHEAQYISRQVVAGNRAQVRQRTGIALQGAWDWAGAGGGAIVGGLLGGVLGALGGPIGAVLGGVGGVLLGGLLGGLIGGGDSQCERLLDRVRQNRVYRSLVGRARALADDIVSVARRRQNCLYYAEKLQLLLDTPEAPRASSGQSTPQGSNLERNRRRVGRAVQQERARLATPEAQQEVSRQEQIANDPARRWTQRVGRNDKFFYVDNSDPANIVVRIKLRLLAGGNVTTSQDIANQVYLEDAIERVAETRGYGVDLVFVDRDGPDVFTFHVDFDRWPTAGNPVGNARTLAHEIHHLMGLQDRYDYIEAHAANRNLAIATRLHWFRRQMDLQPDPQGQASLMGSGRTMLDEDVCRVAGLDLQTCMAARVRSAAQAQ